MAALLTILIAGIGVWIAYNQFRIAQANLRLALFEKRYAVYQAALAFLRSVLSDRGVGLRPHIEFSNIMADAEFLFDDDVMQYLREINGRAARAAAIARASVEERAAGAADLSENLIWLADQVREMPARFMPYMRFAQWRLQKPLYLRGIDWAVAKLRHPP